MDEQRLKAAIWYTVSKIIQEEQSDLGVQITPQFTAALSELVFEKAKSLGIDLELFMKHAGRTTLSVEDLKLCARRNDSLHEIMTERAEELTTKSKGKPTKK